MIHDAKVEVTCDGEGCNAYVEVELPWVYSNMSAASGHYDASLEAISRGLEHQEFVMVGKKTFCIDCAPEL